MKKPQLPMGRGCLLTSYLFMLRLMPYQGRWLRRSRRICRNLKGAPAWNLETDNFKYMKDPKVLVLEESDAVYLEMDVEREMLSIPAQTVSTAMLGMPRITEAPYDDPSGDPIVVYRDYLGKPRSRVPSVGPLDGLQEGHNRIRVWG